MTRTRRDAGHAGNAALPLQDQVAVLGGDTDRLAGRIFADDDRLRDGAGELAAST